MNIFFISFETNIILLKGKNIGKKCLIFYPVCPTFVCLTGGRKKSIMLIKRGAYAE